MIAATRTKSIQVFLCLLITLANAATETCPAKKLKYSQLHSRIQDFSLRNLQSVEIMSDDSSGAVSLKVQGWERKKVLSSKCGALVRIRTHMGQFTLDDTSVSVDIQLENYFRAVGYAHFLEHGRNLGMTLSNMSMVMGYFSHGVGDPSSCDTSPQLGHPDDLIKAHNYHAVVDVTHMNPTATPQNFVSRFFMDDDGTPMDIPGVKRTGDNTGLFTWTEERVYGSGIKASSARYALYPLHRVVKLSKGAANIDLLANGYTGYKCRVQPDAADRMGEGFAQGEDEFAFQGLVEESGHILRHWRINLDNGFADQNERSLMVKGMLPTYIDYFDVDFDESGKREPGSPFRIVHNSTVPGARVLNVAQFLSVETIHETFNVSHVLRLFGVNDLASACNSSNITDDVLNLQNDVDLDVDVQKKNLQNVTVKGFQEKGKEILRMYDYLLGAQLDAARGKTWSEQTKGLDLAYSTEAWSHALRQDPQTYRSKLASVVMADSMQNGTNGTGSNRRLQSRRLGDDIDVTYDFTPTKSFINMLVGDDGFAINWELQNGKLVSLNGVGSGAVPVYEPPTVKITFGGAMGFADQAITGSLTAGITVSFLGWDLVGIMLMVGGAYDIDTEQLTEIFGAFYENINKMFLGPMITLAPDGCGANYYGYWDVTWAISWQRIGRYSCLSFDFDIDLFTIGIGNAEGCEGTPLCTCKHPGAGAAGHNEYTCLNGHKGYCSSTEECFTSAAFRLGNWSAACSAVPTTCECTTPNKGTVGHNKYECTDGTVGYCANDEICYGTTNWLYGDWACSTDPPQQCNCEHPNQGAVGKNCYKCKAWNNKGNIDGCCGSDQQCIAPSNQGFEYGDWANGCGSR